MSNIKDKAVKENVNSSVNYRKIILSNIRHDLTNPINAILGYSELILLDLLMPVMDGFEFLNIAKDNIELKNIPIIVITSKDLTEEDYAFLTDNVDRVIQKGNYTRKELISRINVAIKESNLKIYQKGS